jgi:mannose-6-phosphate isomerase-like protein (cupin superfamily)
MAPLFASRTASASSSAVHGSALTFETIIAEDHAPLRLRPEEDTLLRVIAGMVRVVVEGEERILDAGEEAIVPAGAVHRFESVYGAARFLTGFRPAG